MSAEVPDAGWLRLAASPGLRRWAEAARPLAEQAVATSPAPWRHGATWFVGLDLLPNDTLGGVAEVAFPWTEVPVDCCALHPAQLSVIRPGYPGADPEETEAAVRFRRVRDAAHLDGLLPVGPDRRRMLQEPHGWILGVALNRADPGASPLVVWEGSHQIIAAHLTAAFAPHPPDRWAEVDVTEAYAQARRVVFSTCPRRELPLAPGQATLLHRMTLHGVAPWAEGATAEAPGRMIAYFRPQLSSVQAWMQA